MREEIICTILKDKKFKVHFHNKDIHKRQQPDKQNYWKQATVNDILLSFISNFEQIHRNIYIYLYICINQLFLYITLNIICHFI